MMGVSRTRSAGAKVTEEEYAQLEALAQTRGLTVGEWCRDVLLAQLKPPAASLPGETILAEVLGLRMIMINLLRALGDKETLTPEKVQKVIRWAHTEKLATAVASAGQRSEAKLLAGAPVSRTVKKYSGNIDKDSERDVYTERVSSMLRSLIRYPSLGDPCPHSRFPSL